MLSDAVFQLFRRYRLFCYRGLFAAVHEKDGSLSATEAFSADIIHLLGTPTISQFAAAIGISQPNATYKVNQLTAKGYLEKKTPEADRREVRLCTSAKFSAYFNDNDESLKTCIAALADEFSAEELDTAARVMQTLAERF